MVLVGGSLGAQVAQTGPATFAQNGVRRRQTRHRDAERRAAHVVEADLLEEVDGLGVTTVLTTDTELDVGAGSAALLDRDLGRAAHV